MPRGELGVDPVTGEDIPAPPPTPPVTPTQGGPPVPRPGEPGFMGPLPPGVGPPVTLFGPRGRARFEDEANRQKAQNTFTTGFWGKEFNEWVLSLREDPNDPEYNQVLQWAKRKAEAALKARNPVQDRTRYGSKPLDVFRLTEDEQVPEPGGKVFGRIPGRGGTPGPTQEIDDSEKRRERELRGDIRAAEQPVFKGRKITDDEIYEQHAVGQDAYLNQFLANEGITLSGETKSTALKSGQYVYMGKEVDPTTHAEHDVYMYGQDAEFALVDLGSTQIAAYQKALGLQETGKSDPDLQKLWNYAVDQARGYAARGQKVTVKELMDLYVASAAAEAAKRASGGGGGGRSIPLEDFDYYRVMQQILGDISGVPDAQA
jgi:hypothetical protein